MTLKYILLLLTGWAIGCTGFAQGIKNIAVKDVDGASVTAISNSGKKTLFIVLPSGVDTALTNQLVRFRERQGDKVQVVGILSVEDGYTADNRVVIKKAYKQLIENGMILTEGMHTRKSAGEQQSPLLKWLTDKGSNGHFDMDVSSPGQKFFVSEQGRLYGVLGAETSLDGRIIDKICNTTVPADQTSNINP